MAQPSENAAIEMISLGLLRASIKVCEAASVISVDPSTIYDLVRKGKIEGHKVGNGKKSIRVYVDSLRNYQEDNRIATHHENKAKQQTRAKRLKTTASHKKATAYLRSMGCIN